LKKELSSWRFIARAIEALARTTEDYKAICLAHSGPMPLATLSGVVKSLAHLPHLPSWFIVYPSGRASDFQILLNAHRITLTDFASSPALLALVSLISPVGAFKIPK
jgi:hypothetical protein